MRQKFIIVNPETPAPLALRYDAQKQQVLLGGPRAQYAHAVQAALHFGKRRGGTIVRKDTRFRLTLHHITGAVWHKGCTALAGVGYKFTRVKRFGRLCR